MNELFLRTTDENGQQMAIVRLIGSYVSDEQNFRPELHGAVLARAQAFDTAWGKTASVEVYDNRVDAVVWRAMVLLHKCEDDRRVYGESTNWRYVRAAHGMTVHQLACKWLLMDSALTSITGTLLNEHEIQEAADSVEKPNLTQAEMRELAELYATDYGLGDEVHPCDLKSSTDPSGRVPQRLRPAERFTRQRGHTGGNRMIARYVVLHHTGIPAPHYDLMFDTGDAGRLITCAARSGRSIGRPRSPACRIIAGNIWFSKAK